MKYAILAASLVIQISLGGVYAWSNYVPALKDVYGLSTAQTQMIFGCLFAAFTASMVGAGRLLGRLGPRVVASIGGVLFGAGYLLASQSDGRFGQLLLGISLLAGAGTGFGYVVPLATCIQWFPQRRGLVTGVAVAGFGGGAALLSEAVSLLLSRGMDVLAVFQWVGICYGLAIVASAAVLRVPTPTGTTRPARTPALAVLLRDRFFLALGVGMFCGTFAGMLVIGNLKPLALNAGVGETAATLAVSVFSVGNAAGRVFWGWAVDRLDRLGVPLTLAGLALALALLAMAGSPAVFVAVSLLAGAGFGACFVVYAAMVASRYGPDRVGGVYPMIFLTYGAASVVGPSLGGWLYDATASYDAALILSVAVILAGLVISALLLRRVRHGTVAAALAGSGSR